MTVFKRTLGFCRKLPANIVASDYTFQKEPFEKELNMIYQVLASSVKFEKITEREYKDIRNELMHFNDRLLCSCILELLSVLEMSLEEQEAFSRKYDAVFEMHLFVDKEGKSLPFHPENTVSVLKNIMSKINVSIANTDPNLRDGNCSEIELKERIETIHELLNALKDEDSSYVQFIYEEYYYNNAKYMDDPFLVRLLESNKKGLLLREKEKLQEWLFDYNRRLERMTKPVSIPSQAVHTYYKRRG